MSSEVNSLDVLIIGGGLAGLTTTALLARAGKVVTLIEQSSKEIEGRAMTSVFDGFYFNQGPHALYLSDLGAAVLQELGVTYWRHCCGERIFLFNKRWKETPNTKRL